VKSVRRRSSVLADVLWYVYEVPIHQRRLLIDLLVAQDPLSFFLISISGLEHPMTLQLRLARRVPLQNLFLGRRG
jgi:hypothetical protein